MPVQLDAILIDLLKEVYPLERYSIQQRHYAAGHFNAMSRMAHGGYTGSMSVDDLSFVWSF
jgi:hypothetical protein